MERTPSPSFCSILYFWILVALWISLVSPGEGWLLRKNLPSRELLYEFDWDEVAVSSELKVWHACYNGFECAKLEVPLDWNNVSNPNRVVLAISRLPARADRADASYGGPIVLNPGGPGGSGVDFLLWGGREIQANLDGDKYFDIVSFDPRGVSRSTPSSACFNSSLSRQVYNLKIGSLGTIDLSDDIFNRKWAAVQSFGKVCEGSKIGRYPDGSSIRQFASTAMVAYDMVRIIDKLEEARKDFHHADDHENSEKASFKSPALLQYWGFSYGTVLGNTFASMFPNRIGRLILDGVVDAEDYIATTWTKMLQDNMKTWASFSQLCYEGKSRCPLYDQNTKSPQDIASKVSRLLDHLKDNPMPTAYDGTAQIITYSDVMLTIVVSLYWPGEKFPKLAEVLADLISGNTSSMAPLLSKITLDDDDNGDDVPDPTPDVPPSATKKNNSWDQPMPPDDPSYDEASRTVVCGDGDSIENRTKAQHKAYIDQLYSQSPLTAGMWSEITLTCVGWPARLRPSDKHRFTGPFGSTLSDLDARGRPILWISNTADPVTPLRNGRKMAEAHEGSAVLVVEQPGHATGPPNPSKCVYEVARRYFSDGALPGDGTVCESDFIPWRNADGGEFSRVVQSAGTEIWRWRCTAWSRVLFSPRWQP